MSPCFADDNTPSVPLYLVDAPTAEAFLETQGPAAQRVASEQGWTGSLGTPLVMRDGHGATAWAAIGGGDGAARARRRFGAVANLASLPHVCFHLAEDTDPQVAADFALGWLLSQYRFDRYKAQSPLGAVLRAPRGVDVDALIAQAGGEFLTRDLINTPASDMGPAELEAAVHTLAAPHGAAVEVIRGDDLLTHNLPMIHAVGRGSDRAPRLIDMTWGQAGPRLVLVGKGVCFDTGGLNIKPAAAMGLMKKDMGGAAHVLGLAHMIMTTGWDVQLRVLIPAVENSINGAGFRPQDILTSRKGLTVEVNNTDAEGRLVLADALALADETPPDLMISMATLTGAARVAVGPDIAPYFTDDADLAGGLDAAGGQVQDPVWRLPFHAGYEAMIEPDIADLDNAPPGGFAGAITAALFLRRFVTQTPRFVHFDCYGWQPKRAAARPKGGVGQGTRALFAALPKALGL